MARCMQTTTTMSYQNWEIKIIQHRGESRIAFFFPYIEEDYLLVRSFPEVNWSQSKKCWYIPDTPANRLEHGLTPSLILNETHREHVTNFKRWLASRRYSPNTIKTYSEALKSFLLYYNDTAIEDIEVMDIIRYNNDYILANKLSNSYQNQIVNAIKLFFRTIANRKLELDLVHRPKRMKTLPNVLSKQEVKQILDAHGNLKHRMMLSLIYSCGLRCGELLRLTFASVDSMRRVLIIKQAKGRKDRIAPLSLKILEMLREYVKYYRPVNYLFEGQQKGEPYDERSLQQVLKQALVKTSISKPVTLHWLRHSYATHLLESGTDLRYIQEILGHQSSKTTEIYTHVSTKSIQQIISPFDYL